MYLYKSTAYLGPGHFESADFKIILCLWGTNFEIYDVKTALFTFDVNGRYLYFRGLDSVWRSK